MKKENTHIVIKREDALKYLTEVEYQTLEEFMNIIIRGRAKDHKKPINNYYICNTDEPYAELVHGVIIGGETTKANNNNATYCPDACGNGCVECFSKGE